MHNLLKGSLIIMKEKMVKPEMEIVTFNAEDVITVSPMSADGGNTDTGFHGGIDFGNIG